MQIVWWLIGALFLSIVVLIVYLKLIRSYLRKKRFDLIKFKSMYEALLIEYLYSGDDSNILNEVQESIIEKLKDYTQIKSQRKIIISILYDLMNEVSGEMSVSIRTLYYKTGLINFALEQLKSKSWFVIAQGIGQLRRFQIDDVHNQIAVFINHSKYEVRNETQLYFVSLFRFEGLLFLNELESPLSDWAQVQLLEILQKFDDQQICDIHPWLNSKNETVVSFALKLTQIYNQFEVKDTLIELLSHKSKDIRVQVIDVLTHLYDLEAKEMLKANFNELSIEEQISFFGLLEKLVVPNDEPFVEKHLFHKNFEIQLLALNILKSINIDKYMGLHKLPKSQKSSAMLKSNTL
jgi:hypothetical protein